MHAQQSEFFEISSLWSLRSHYCPAGCLMTWCCCLLAPLSVSDVKIQANTPMSVYFFCVLLSLLARILRARIEKLEFSVKVDLAGYWQEIPFLFIVHSSQSVQVNMHVLSRSMCVIHAHWTYLIKTNIHMRNKPEVRYLCIKDPDNRIREKCKNSLWVYLWAAC